ncbi:Trans-2,3-dihydro-3-hydroxyanthranilate isomerase (plasmid) [Variovorax sp. PBS-H4]|uniref:PhzF family phenazine biosynthesis protein n=1 Tax=Variovorax sp. PBS-H4 TaxID=434008 RepID=UPI001317B879|nr:PhzF family phenazine biosynthesis protein [Variovorax sp. PBS-H4]VTU41386.1 Trans-2,3-dihydro-3-hydroxyanthranilate isomerase [Variovorax sp. PBS-H4]
MPRFLFSQVDVFAPAALLGNPVAVVHGADCLDDEQLAAFARWTNLSETTFLLRPTIAEADYRLRIFTPGGELPFAGHPTLGSAHAWLEAGGVAAGSEIMQECGIGLVGIRRTDDGLAFRAPALLKSGPVEPEVLNKTLSALGVGQDQVLRVEWADNGPGWVGVVLDSAETVRSLQPDLSKSGELSIGVIGRDLQGPADYEVRAFDPGAGEDPVTGSLNAAFAVWLIPLGVLPPQYTVRQGTALQREGQVFVTSAADGSIWVGGRCVTVVDGQLELPTDR